MTLTSYYIRVRVVFFFLICSFYCKFASYVSYLCLFASISILLYFSTFPPFCCTHASSYFCVVICGTPISQVLSSLLFKFYWFFKADVTACGHYAVCLPWPVSCPQLFHLGWWFPRKRTLLSPQSPICWLTGSGGCEHLLSTYRPGFACINSPNPHDSFVR